MKALILTIMTLASVVSHADELSNFRALLQTLATESQANTVPVVEESELYTSVAQIQTELAVQFQNADANAENLTAIVQVRNTLLRIIAKIQASGAFNSQLKVAVEAKEGVRIRMIQLRKASESRHREVLQRQSQDNAGKR